MTHSNTIYRKNRPASVAANAVKHAAQRKSVDQERADRLAALDPSATMSLAEIELIEIYRAAKPDMREATLTVMRIPGKLDRQK